MTKELTMEEKFEHAVEMVKKFVDMGGGEELIEILEKCEAQLEDRKER